MKKGIIAVTALLTASAVSIGAFLAVRSKKEKEDKLSESSKAENILYDLDPESISSISITNVDGSFDLSFSDEKWKLSDDNEAKFSVNQVTAQGICTYIANLTANDNYGEINDESKAMYGLDDPYTVRISDGSYEHTLYIGNLSPTGDFYYCYTNEKNYVFTISAESAGYIIAEKLDLIDDKIIGYDTIEIEKLTLDRDGKNVYELTLDQTGKYWKLPEKYDMLVIDQTKITQALAVIVRLTALEIIPNGKEYLSQYGFDKPISELTINGTDGGSVKLLASKYGQQQDTYTYIYNSNTDLIEKYYAADLDLMNYDMFDFIANKLEYASMYTVSGFEITSESISTSFAVDMNEMYAEFDGNRLDLNNAEIESYFTTFYNTFSYMTFDEMDVDAKPVLEDPVFSVKYTFTDGSAPVNIDYVPTGEEGRLYIFLNNEYTGAICPDIFTVENDMVSTAFDTLCRQAGI